MPFCSEKLSAVLPLLEGDALELLQVLLQEDPVAADAVLGAAADLPLHPFAVAAADGRKLAGGAEPRLPVGTLGEGCPDGRVKNLPEAADRKISHAVLVHAVEVAGVYAAV